jgi:hypothetical protein
MAKRQAGAWLIIGGVILSILTTGVAILGGSAAMSRQIRQADGTVSALGPGYLLLAASLGLVGLGVALLSVSGPIYGGTLARRALMSLGFGLVAMAVTLGISTRPGFEGSNVMVLFIPLLVFGTPRSSPPLRSAASMDGVHLLTDTRWGRRRYAARFRAEHGSWPWEVMRKG